MSRTPDPRDPSEPLPTVERTSPWAAGPDSVPALAHALDLLGGVLCAPLAPLVRWSASGAGSVLVHRVPAVGVSLGTLRSEGPLRSGHVLAVALAVTEALVALHHCGLAHGGIDVTQVLVAPDGSVVLTGTGLAWRTAPGVLGGPAPEADVAAVGELVRLLLGRGGAPGALVLAALRASDVDPTLRPDAATLLELLRASGRPESLLDALWRQPVAPPPPPAPLPRPATGTPPRPGAPRRPPNAVAPLTPGTGSPIASSGTGSPAPSQVSGPPDPSRPRTRRAAPPARRRPAIDVRTMAAVALVAVVGLGAVRAVAVVGAGAAESVPAASPGDATPSPASSSAPATVRPTMVLPATGPVPARDWTAVLAALDSGRRAALASGSADDLARWVDPSGGAWARDSALQRRLAASSARITGGELVLQEVQLMRSDDDRVVLAVRDRRAAYDVAQNGATTHVAQRGSAWWVVTLTPVPALDGDGWRLADVRGREARTGT